MIPKKTPISVEAKNDFLERQSNSSALPALAELVWNGLDAGSNKIDIEFELDAFDGIELIRVRDYGSGIAPDKVESFFGSLGESWKKNKHKVDGRVLHGKNGQGRFKAFALGGEVIWNTVHANGAGTQSYSIFGQSNALTEFFFTTPEDTPDSASGTVVEILDTKDGIGDLIANNAHEEFTKIFAAYLTQYPNIRINYNGTNLDPTLVQESSKELPLPDIRLSTGENITASMQVIEWSVAVPRTILLCDSHGVSLGETKAGVRAPGFQFTAYLKTDHFRELDKDNSLMLEAHPDVDAVLSPAKVALRGYFRQRLAERQSHIVERWKEEEIYPYVEADSEDPVRETERQVFDILAVNVQSYLPAFEDKDKKSKKFMFKLLAQALRNNPQSVQLIITEVLSLKKEEQEDLAELLGNTPLSNIISSAKTVANRLDFLTALENLLFDKETKKKLLERDQLHKILEREAWIFDEDFLLSGSEERMEEVLRKHIGVLGKREDGETDVIVGDGKTGRIDLQLSRATSPRSGEHDYLIVELKRPSKKIDDEVITQVKKYAMAVANDERFRGVPARWKFVAVSNEMNDYARNDASQPDRPKGQVWISPDRMISVWVREWGEVINTARARLDFVNKSLSYEATRESAKEYLLKAHEKFIPKIDLEDKVGEHEGCGE